MISRFVRSLVKTLATSFVLLNAVGVAQADPLLEARLGALLGQEREAIAQVPDARLAALTAVPPATARDIPTAPDVITYDNAFLSSQPVASGGEQWRCLAEALYFEARGESARGLFAVGEVILNRVDSARFPDTLCGVIHQGTGRRYACNSPTPAMGKRK